MALIKCPECGKEISDKAPACIHCGYPMNLVNNDTVDEKKYKIILINYGDSKLRIVHFLCQFYGINIGPAKQISENLPATIIDGVTIDKVNEIKSVLDTYNAIIKIEISDGKVSEDIRKMNDSVDLNSLKKPTYTTQEISVQCPYCKSFNTSKISVGARVMDNAIWGLFSTKRNKQWKCKDCGSEF